MIDKEKSTCFLVMGTTVVAGLVLFVSMILPFYYRYTYEHMPPDYEVTYLISYRSFSVSSVATGYSSGTERFVDSFLVTQWFWSREFYDKVSGSRLWSVFTLLLATQIMTSLAAVSSVYTHMRLLLFLSMAGNALAIGLMNIAAIDLSSKSYTLSGLCLGYWLAYPSLALFYWHPL